MKKTQHNKSAVEPVMRREYDFSGGVRGKYSQAFEKGHDVRIHRADQTIAVRRYTMQEGAVMLAPDVRVFFPDSESVNEALRALIRIAPVRRQVSRKTRKSSLPAKRKSTQ